MKPHAVGTDSVYDAVSLMDQLHVDQLPVLSDDESSKWLGIIDRKKILKTARKNILSTAT